VVGLATSFPPQRNEKKTKGMLLLHSVFQSVNGEGRVILFDLLVGWKKIK